MHSDRDVPRPYATKLSVNGNIAVSKIEKKISLGNIIPK